MGVPASKCTVCLTTRGGGLWVGSSFCSNGMKLPDTFTQVCLCEPVSISLGSVQRLAQELTAHTVHENLPSSFPEGCTTLDSFQRHMGDQGFLAGLLCHFRSLDSGETRSWPQSPRWFFCLPRHQPVPCWSPRACGAGSALEPSEHRLGRPRPGARTSGLSSPPPATPLRGICSGHPSPSHLFGKAPRGQWVRSQAGPLES